MVLQRGAWQGRQIVPADWLDAAITASAPGGKDYGFQWWLPPDATPGEVMAQGVYGQYIYINRALGVVIAMNAADRGFEDDGSTTAASPCCAPSQLAFDPPLFGPFRPHRQTLERGRTTRPARG